MDDGTANNNILDSTTNRFGGVKQAAGSPAETDAVVGRGQLFASNRINLTGLTNDSTTHTVSMWVKGSSSAALEGVDHLVEPHFAEFHLLDQGLQLRQVRFKTQRRGHMLS